MSNSTFIEAHNLKVYQLSRELSKNAWVIYDALKYEDRKTMGEQFLRSADSVGANIIEGYGRYHFLDKMRFYYYSRASLNESIFHWLDLLFERNKVTRELHEQMFATAKELQVKLNNFIGTTYNQYKMSKNAKTNS